LHYEITDDISFLFFFFLFVLIPFVIQHNAVGSATINFSERYPIIFKTGKTLQNCESFVPFSFLIVLNDFVVIFNFGCYVLSLIKSKFGDNRLIQASGLNGPIPPGIAFLENLTDL